jgi:hypothetical protein
LIGFYKRLDDKDSEGKRFFFLLPPLSKEAQNTAVKRPSAPTRLATHGEWSDLEVAFQHPTKINWNQSVSKSSIATILRAGNNGGGPRAIVTGLGAN